MSAIQGLNAALKSVMCGSLEITPVPIGYAVSTGFVMPDGDLLSFYLVDQGNGTFTLEDDGMTLPAAIASGLDLKSPVREGLLRGMLTDEGVRYDEDLTIRSEPVAEGEIGSAALHFISAMIRTRDLALLSRENVAASFADDVRRELCAKLPPGLAITDDGRPADLSGPDIVIRDTQTGIKVARIFAAGGDLRLMDALVDYQASDESDSPIIAVVDRRKGRVTDRRLNTATNRGLPMAVLDGASDEWTGRVLGLIGKSSADINARTH
ncbi:DUF1828 domain-containing protein [Neotabrizicola sp. VNH66]|uniref:DUF1828 domain-containing protein n=1 Tax=Neotabrizicola sp. VNH66 TaxID=3400918 RepID=UPI003BFC7963